MTGPGAPAATPRPSAQRVPAVRIRGVARYFGDVAAVDGVDLDIAEGEFFSLLGASGCGKTTLLRIIAGFETPDAGTVLVGGQDMAGVPSYRRPVNMMFQSYALFPHMTVADNVAFGLRQEGLPKSEIAHRVAAMLDLVQLAGLAGRKPSQLSGGQSQRVALTRCLVKQPKVLLLDEPLAALDRKLREQTRFELVNIQQRVGITFIMVTHDQEEAMTMSSRIAVMDAGRIVQVGPPNQVYESPVNRMVAEFIGTANLFDGTVEQVSAGTLSVRVDGIDSAINAAGASRAGARVTVMLRPEKIGMTQVNGVNGVPRGLAGTVCGVAYLGHASTYQVVLESGRMVIVSRPNLHHGEAPPPALGDAVQLDWQPGDAVVLP